MIDALHGFGLGLISAGWWTGLAWPVIWTLIKEWELRRPAQGRQGKRDPQRLKGGRHE